MVILSMSLNSPYPSPSNAAHRSATKIWARFKKRTFLFSNLPSSLKQLNFSASRFTRAAAELFASSISVTTLPSNSCNVSHKSTCSSVLAVHHKHTSSRIWPASLRHRILCSNMGISSSVPEENTVRSTSSEHSSSSTQNSGLVMGMSCSNALCRMATRLQ